jgi:hypothetical protein
MTWTINQLERQTSDGLVTTIHWTASAVDGDYSASINNTQQLERGDSFVDYASLTEEIWLTAGSNYKFVLTDSFSVVIQTYDNLYGIIGTTGNVSAVPSGGIIMWSGSIGSVPSGYYLCDGTNGTPDLRDRFVVGSGSTYAVGNTGGFTSSVTSNIGTNLPLYYSLAFIQKS